LAKAVAELLVIVLLVVAAVALVFRILLAMLSLLQVEGAAAHNLMVTLLAAAVVLEAELMVLRLQIREVSEEHKVVQEPGDLVVVEQVLLVLAATEVLAQLVVKPADLPLVSEREAGAL
jgi:hypothetical protein